MHEMFLSTVAALSVLSVVGAFNSKPYAQDNDDQFNLLRYTGTTGPYVPHRGYGISKEVPYGCEVTQAHLAMRHGERFATKGTGKSQYAVYKKLKNANVTDYTGPLAFVEDWEYFTPDTSKYEAESEYGWYAGLADAYNTGVTWREQYGHLYDGKTVHPIFAGGQERVVDTARSFGKGFFAQNYTNLASIQVIPEEPEQGANTLTSHDACNNYDGDVNDDIINQFDDSYLVRAANRLNALSPGFNLNSTDIYNLLGYCGFELNVKGNSEVCEILTTEEWVSFAYSKSLDFYYQNGPGYNLSNALGWVYANNTHTLMAQEYPYNLTFSFIHDSDLLTFTTALGLFEPDYDLSTSEIEHDSVFKVSEIAPMGGRIVHERLECKVKNETESFVRVIVNDAVIPIPGCQGGPGFSCSLDGYKNVIDNRLGNTTYIEACGVNSTVPQYTTFYWDWEVTFDEN